VLNLIFVTSAHHSVPAPPSPLHAPLRSTRVLARSAPFSAPLTQRSHALPTTEFDVGLHDVEMVMSQPTGCRKRQRQIIPKFSLKVYYAVAYLEI